jgi:hypothetical protein
MKLGLQNYALIMQINNSFIAFNSNTVNSLQRCDIAQNKACSNVRDLSLYKTYFI